MVKLKTRNGLKAYRTTREELALIGGIGICDHCGEHVEVGYLVPVLNHWVCEECYKGWQGTAKHYKEDDWIEDKNAAYYESCIPVEVEE